MNNIKTFQRYKRFELWGGTARSNSVDYDFFISDNKENKENWLASVNQKTNKIEFISFDELKKEIPRMTLAIYIYFNKIIMNFAKE